MPDLPKTFRDALQFIKAIGISFIWIDSFCIIQDSVKDWEFECIGAGFFKSGQLHGV